MHDLYFPNVFVFSRILNSVSAVITPRGYSTKQVLEAV